MDSAPFDTTAVDFEEVYRGGELMADMRFERPPWDIDAPQPIVVATEQAGGFTGSVLDAGSGTGNNAIYLAGRGYRVTGVDGSSAAVELARGRAAERGVQVSFQIEQATELAGLGQDYDTVLDSALFHCLPTDSRAAYSAALHRVTKPGATLHLFCFADQGAQPSPFPPITQEDLRASFGQHWDIADIELVSYQGGVTLDEARREFGKIAPDMDFDAMETDADGRVVFPMWHLRATRR